MSQFDEAAPWRDLHPDPTQRPGVRPPVVSALPQFPDPTESLKRKTCPKCGMVLAPVMVYVCGDTHCPTFLKVTC